MSDTNSGLEVSWRSEWDNVIVPFGFNSLMDEEEIIEAANSHIVKMESLLLEAEEFIGKRVESYDSTSIWVDQAMRSKQKELYLKIKAFREVK